MVTVPCRCSRCAGNRWSLNVASHMVWARWCPCTTQMHTLVSIQSLCTDPVNQTSLTAPLDLTVIKSEYTSTRYRAPPLPAFIAGNTDLKTRGFDKLDQKNMKMCEKSEKNKNIHINDIFNKSITFLQFSAKRTHWLDNNLFMLAHAQITEYWSLCISGGGDRENLKNPSAVMLEWRCETISS